MPPASLSTFAVMNPGPTTAKNSRIRIFQLFRNFMRTFHGHMDGANSRDKRRNRINVRSEFGQRKSTECRYRSWVYEIEDPSPKTRHRSLQFAAKHADHIVRRDDSRELVVLVHDGESQQIVFIEQFGHIVLLDSFMSEDEWFLGQREHRI